MGELPTKLPSLEDDNEDDDRHAGGKTAALATEAGAEGTMMDGGGPCVEVWESTFLGRLTHAISSSSSSKTIAEGHLTLLHIMIAAAVCWFSSVLYATGAERARKRYYLSLF